MSAQKLDESRAFKKRRTSSASSPSLLPADASGVMLPLAKAGDGLELTETESTLRRLLLDVADYVNSYPTSTGNEASVSLPKELAESKIVLRFTGGWVRDKLLRVNSHDIDVAINKMTGYQFGLKMREYLEIPGNPQKYGLQGVASTDAQSANAGTDKSKVVGGLHKIEANPEKSKHLETVTTKVLGLDIDLVNLRKETYTEESRNPQMEFGTPEEDALRRDATVNAMFYNLNTSEVEDFTGSGFRDMEKKIIRTPLEPYQTFKDDPLRVLRLIRFASRLNYVIDPTAEMSMEDERIKDALRLKISRERVGIEVEKMLKGNSQSFNYCSNVLIIYSGPRPHMALDLIERLGLYSTIFTDPTKEIKYKPEVHRLQSASNTLKIILNLQDESRNSILREIVLITPEERYMAMLIVAHIPWVDAPIPEPLKPGKKAPPPIPVAVAREGIKAPNKICDVLSAAVSSSENIIQLKDRLAERKRYPRRRIDGEDPASRDVLGMAIRSWGASWRSQVLWTLLSEVSNDTANQERILDGYSTFLSELKALDLYEAYAFKPLVDGKTLANALSTKPGPWMKSALDVVMAWQLRNPDITDPAAAIEEVRIDRQNQEAKSKQPTSETTVNHAKKGELTNSLIHHFLALNIRPLFAQTPRPKSITASGRQRTTETLPKKFEALSMEDESVTKPWKTDIWALDLLSWCLHALPSARPDTVEKEWGLLVPPLLTMVDDIDIHIKARGCKMLNLLLRATPPHLLSRTGLAIVIEDAVMPFFSYLPTLTPEDQTIALIDAAFPTLLTLTDLRFSTPSPPFTSKNPSKKTSPSNPQDAKTKALTHLLRHGILTPFSHINATNTSTSYPNLTTALLTHLIPLLQLLGLDAIPHLKHTIPLLSSILRDPFGAAYPPMLVEATKALQMLILMAWPRLPSWRAEVMGSCGVCWIRLMGDEGENSERREGVEMVRSELTRVVEVLKEALRVREHGTEKVDWDEEVEQYLAADERLVGLFGGDKDAG
ncbi:MAG: CCA tRNA nucleotidyltransferase, mitochondrial [Bogoriella megaspora]|nr:MAG: CCA tRNA nucleotidyltransferase, mitochondrial [Bogoriella megaspora]